MNQASVCTKCGLALPEGFEGLCPRCLLEPRSIETQSTEQPPPEARADTSIATSQPDFGNYHTIGVLGEGGMGIVYLAEQREPVRRRVALKVLKRTDDRSSFIARFESESQALAMMEHPSIARVYDAGTTPEGRLYFAMEYVPGIPITDYCDRNLLGLRDRLMLFEQVCHAVQHAHQKGIIHRDLKPSNVLVMVQDGKAVPKVIDFGIAKAVNQRLTEKTLFTEIGMLIGTPEYMSPEQADLTGLDVDSTTDVYSLGVLLYELLVGALPFDSKVLRRAGYAEIQRVIREEEPPKPTTRLSSMGSNAQEIARHRRTDVPALIRRVRGDLEWISMKALEKDWTRRYASASEFAADIARHLASEPVMAGPPNVGYRLRKFVHRHQGLVGAGLAVFLTLVVAAVVSFSLYLHAVREQERAEIEGYAANLSAADIQLRSGQVDDAKSRLAAAPAHLRGWEWHHLMARTDESSATMYSPEFAGQDVHVRLPQMRFSQDGTQLFSYGSSFLRSWDIATKRVATELSGLGRVLAVGPHGKTVLMGPLLSVMADPPAEGFVLRLYELSTKRVLAEFRGLTKDPGAATISDDGALVAVAEDTTNIYQNEPARILIWDAHTARLNTRLDGHPRWVRNIEFSPDGRLLASASADRTVQLWDSRSGRKRTTLQHRSYLRAIAFSPDGRLLASGDEPRMRIWDTESGRLVREWNVGSAIGISSIAFSPDGAQLAACLGGAIRIWDATTGQPRFEFNGDVTFAALTFHPTVPRLYTTQSSVLKEWDLGRPSPALGDAEGGISSVAISPDGRYLASGSGEGMTRIYDAASLKHLRTLAGHKEPVTVVVFSPDSTLLASASSDKTIRLWHLPDGLAIGTLAGHTDSIWSIVFTPDGSQLISGSQDHTIRIWDLEPNIRSKTISTTSAISAVTISGDGRTIAALRKNDKSVSLWNSRTQEALGVLSTQTLELSPVQPRSMALSPDRLTLLTPANTGQAIAIWDLSRRRLSRMVPVFRGKDQITSMAISPDGSRVAIGQLNTGDLSVWDLRRGKRLTTLNGHTGGVRSLAWTPDGTRLVSGSADNTVRVWDSRSSHNHEAELLLDNLSDRCFLVEEMIRELERDRTINDELRKKAIQLAKQRGNAPYFFLTYEAWNVGRVSGRSHSEYTQALRRATVAVQVAPGNSSNQLVLALLLCRTGDFHQALAPAQRAMDIQKSQAPSAHAIRAMAFHGSHDRDQARAELVLARQAPDRWKGPEDLLLVEEAESLVSGRK